MRILTLAIPDSLELDNLERAMLLASTLYEQGKLSLGQAAEMAGLTKEPLLSFWVPMMFQ